MEQKKRFFIQTFGCQMNEHDSETLAGMLIEMGYEQCFEDTDVDLIILNTCSIRENADLKFFGTLGMLKKRKLKSPGLTLAVCGIFHRHRSFQILHPPYFFG